MNFIKKYCSCGKIIGLHEKCSCKTYSRKIDKDKSRFYSSYGWKKLRNMRVKEQPYCERCWSLYKLIVGDFLQGHHILSYKHYDHLKLDYLNVAVLCRTCNVQIGDSNTLDWSVSDEVREYVEVNR